MTKSLAQALVLGMSGKTISDVKIAESGNTVLTFKSGDKISFNINMHQGFNYSSLKDKPSKIDKLVKNSTKMLEKTVKKPEVKSDKSKIKVPHVSVKEKD